MPRVSRGRSDIEDPAQVVYGVHPVQELLMAGARRVERVFVLQGRHARLGRLLRLAREAGVPVSHVEREVLVRKVGRQAAHQGVAARVAAVAYADADEICRAAATARRATLVLVDRVVDPRNLGAIVRTAAAAGACGVLLSVEDTVGLTPVAVKASAGAVERVPVAREARPARRLEELRAAGFGVVALDPTGEPLWEVERLEERIVCVAGGEQAGPSRGVLRACERRLAIPLARGVESLNVAVALGVLLFEALRRRRTDSERP